MGKNNDDFDDFEDFMLFKMITSGGGCLMSVLSAIAVTALMISFII